MVSNVDMTALDAGQLEAQLSKLTVKVLKEKLKEVYLPTSGRKAQLVTRLTQHILSKQQEEHQNKIDILGIT